MLHVSALASREIRAVLLALKQAEPEIRKAVNNQSKQVILPVWRQEIAEATSLSGGKTQRARFKVLSSTAKVTVGNKGVTLTAATTGKPLSGGLDGKTYWYALEFGATQRALRTVRSTSKLGKHYVMKNRDIHAQLDPRNYGGKTRAQGYSFYPAARETVPRILSLWVQTSVKTLIDIVERKA
jgi:hypothetical protein